MANAPRSVRSGGLYLVGALSILVTASQLRAGGLNISGDNFNDNTTDTSIWAVRQTSPGILEVQEASNRLQFPSNTNFAGIDAAAGYVSNGWAFDASSGVSRIKLTWHFAPPAPAPNAGDVGLAVGFSLEPDPDPLALEDAVVVMVGRDDAWYVGIEIYVGGILFDWDYEEVSLGTQGQVFVKYDAGTDTLYASSIGYNDPNALQVPGIGAGVDLSQLTFFMGAYSQGVNAPGLSGNEIWIDDFVIDNANLFPIPRWYTTDCDGNWAPAGWVGDGFCDDGSWDYDDVPIYLDCPQFDFDDGDCPLPDSHPFIAWRKRNAAANSMWLMDGLKKLPESGPIQAVDRDWIVAATGDFNGDDHCDIFWRNEVNGKNSMWFMVGRDKLGSSGPVQTVSTDWFVAGTGHFNDDNYCDILWRKHNAAANSMWLMNGRTKLPASGPLLPVASIWTVAGTGFFNDDNFSDILWRNQTSGKNSIWMMNGRTKLPDSGPILGAGSNWIVAGIGFFNNDDHSDILWRDQVTGKNWMRMMDGRTTAPGSGSVPGVHPSWICGGVRDFDGDQYWDILWRRQSNGKNAMWLMMGRSKRAGSGPLPNVAPVWEPAGTGN
jgi:hypothetical protein